MVKLGGQKASAFGTPKELYPKLPLWFVDMESTNHGSSLALRCT